jgi:Ribonuclease G/E
VLRVLPGMQAAFVEIGIERSGLSFTSPMCWPRAARTSVSPTTCARTS